jgi:hypothetical protein
MSEQEILDLIRNHDLETLNKVTGDKTVVSQVIQLLNKPENEQLKLDLEDEAMRSVDEIKEGLKSSLIKGSLLTLILAALLSSCSTQKSHCGHHSKQYGKGMKSVRFENKIEEESASGDIGVGAGPIMTPKAFAKKGQKINAATKYSEKMGMKKVSMNETLIQIVKEELLKETSYNKFKNEVKYRTKNEMLHKSIREVKRKLEEVERLVEYTTRIKQELSENEDGISYWKRSLKAINEISEVSNKISNKIKSIYQ